MVAKSSLVSRENGQGGSEQLGILWYIIIHNRHMEGESTHITIEWAQSKVGEGTIVTSGYRWITCVCVCTYVYAVVQAKYSTQIIAFVLQ